MCDTPYASLELTLPVPLTAQEIAHLVRDVVRQIDWDDHFRTDASFVGRRRLHLSRAFELGMTAPRSEYGIRVVASLTEPMFRLYDEGFSHRYTQVVVTSHDWSTDPEQMAVEVDTQLIEEIVDRFHTDLVDYARRHYNNPVWLESLDWEEIDAPEPDEDEEDATD